MARYSSVAKVLIVIYALLTGITFWIFIKQHHNRLDGRHDHVLPNSHITAFNASAGKTTGPHGRSQLAGEAIKNNTEEKEVGKRIEGIPIQNQTIDVGKMTPRELLDRVVMVTAISQNHFEECKGMIGSVQEFMPNKRIIMYDLGLTSESVRMVKRLCNVELRSFNFTKYPPHVKHLFQYAWKPLVVQETLEEFGIVFWCDASIRFKKDPLVLFSILKEQKGFVTIAQRWIAPPEFDSLSHPDMYKALGVDRETFQNDKTFAIGLGTGRLIFVNSPYIQKNMIIPWVECALNWKCIAPKGSVLPVNHRGPVQYTHRFDQATLVVILYKNLRGSFHRGNDHSELMYSVAETHRSPVGSEKAKFCKG